MGKVRRREGGKKSHKIMVQKLGEGCGFVKGRKGGMKFGEERGQRPGKGHVRKKLGREFSKSSRDNGEL